MDEDITRIVDSTDMDECAEADGCTKLFDDTLCVDVGSSEVATGKRVDIVCRYEELAANDKETSSGTNADDDITGVVDSTTVDGSTDVVGCTTLLNDKICIGDDSPNVSTGVLDDTSCTAEERAANDEETSSGTDVDGVDKMVLESATADENNDVVRCISVFDETPGVDNEPLEDDTGRLDDISCTSEEVANNDETVESGTDDTEANIAVADSTGVGDSTEAVD